MHPFAAVPEIISIIMKGRLIPLIKDSNNYFIDHLSIILANYHKIVLLPFASNASQGLYIVEAIGDNKYLCNRMHISIEELHTFIGSLDRYMLMNYIQQADYAHTIYPYTVNTIRVMTLYDIDNNDILIPMAAHKFGTSLSYPAETVLNGGLLANIDVTNGTINHVITRSNRYNYTQCICHPDSNAPIEGIVIPYWDTLKARLSKIAHYFSFLPYIGWDIVITNTGFVIIEGNINPGLESIQILQPFCKLPEVRRVVKQLKTCINNSIGGT